MSYQLQFINLTTFFGCNTLNNFQHKKGKQKEKNLFVLIKFWKKITKSMKNN